MSAIRPHLPVPTGPLAAPAPSPLRAAQAAFFQAALQGVAAAPTERAPTPAAEATRAAPADRAQRPGALLDIRV